jgi:hypothetical protein
MSSDSHLNKVFVYGKIHPVNIFMVLIKLKLLCNYLLAKMLQYHISFK